MHPTPTTTKNMEVPKAQSPLKNVAAPNVPFYTPIQPIPAGAAIIHKDASSTSLPLLFQPLKLRGLTLQNRIIVSPMCEYSADDGHFTDWHLVHLGGIISRGPGLTILEATAVTAEGRITPEDAGLWKDSQIAPLKRIVDFAHSQGQHVAIQLGHAGRKASTVAPWIDRKAAATADVGGWPDKVVSASDVPYDGHTCIPRKMNLEDIGSFKKSFAAAVQRAVKAGVDVSISDLQLSFPFSVHISSFNADADSQAIEIHAAHGYFIHQTLVEATNDLPAPYSGSFENRIRLLLEIASATRAAIPSSMPLLVRVPGSDWMGHKPSVKAFYIKQCVELAKALSAPELGVDFIDVTSGGLLAEQKITSGPNYQAPFSEAVKKAVEGTGVKVGVVGMVREGSQAEELLQKGVADVVLAGRGFQKNTALVWQWADELGVEIRLANQIGWGFGQRPGGGMKGEQAVKA